MSQSEKVETQQPKVRSTERSPRNLEEARELIRNFNEKIEMWTAARNHQG